MKRAQLGEFEELVLLMAGLLDGNAYTVTIVEEVATRTGRRLTLSAVHTVLNRLEKKDFFNLIWGDRQVNEVAGDGGFTRLPPLVSKSLMRRERFAVRYGMRCRS